MRIVLIGLVLALGFSGSAVAAGEAAGLRIAVTPNPGRADQALVVTVESFRTTCSQLPLQIGTQVLAGGVIRFRLDGTDACGSFPPHARSYVVGPLAAGEYTFRFAYCGFNVPDGVDDCAPSIADIPVRVRGVASAVHAIPATSANGAGLLALLALCLGVRAARRRRRAPAVPR